MKDVIDKWLDEERKMLRTRGKMTKKRKIIIDKMLNEPSPFATLFKIEKQNK